jgi:hypothetical protein
VADAYIDVYARGAGSWCRPPARWPIATSLIPGVVDVGDPLGEVLAAADHRQPTIGADRAGCCAHVLSEAADSVDVVCQNTFACLVGTVSHAVVR